MNRSICVVLIIVAILVMASCGNSPTARDFDFSMSYGVGGRDYVSTIDNTLIVDTVQGQKETKLVIKDKDKVLIKQKIIDSSIIGEDFSFLRNTYVMAMPCEVCKLSIQINGKEYSYNWTSENMMPHSFDMVSNKVTVEEKYVDDYEKLIKLYEIKGYITELINKYPEVKQLPEHQLYE